MNTHKGTVRWEVDHLYGALYRKGKVRHCFFKFLQMYNKAYLGLGYRGNREIVVSQAG